MADLVIGMGEIGKPLADLLSLNREVLRKDKESLDAAVEIETIHVCFPYGETFVTQVQDYIAVYKPKLAIVHSTVIPGTTRRVASEGVAYSPIRGRHRDMHRDLIRYTKYVSAPNQATVALALDSLSSPFLTKVVTPCEALELAKLVETTYSGLLIAWAQELDRYCTMLNLPEVRDVLSLTAEVEWLPDHVFHPGFIGGHCIIQNLALLEEVRLSPFTEAIRQSNESCTQAQKASQRRFRPEKL